MGGILLVQKFLPAVAEPRGEGGSASCDLYLRESGDTVYSVPFQHVRINKTCPKNLIDSRINPSALQRHKTENSKKIFP